MSGLHIIEGRGGKSGGSGATESKDTLRSTQLAEIMDAISEGECEGLVDGLKSIYLDGVAIQNDDDTYNFTGATVAWTNGTQGQAAMPGFDGVKTEYVVNVETTYAAPVVRTITNPDIDKVRVTISVPQLSKTDTDTGSLGASLFSWAIEVQSNGGGFVQVYGATLAGKAMSEYTRSVEFDLTGSAPWDIRVKRTSTDSTSSAVVNAFTWASYTAIQTVKLRYPNTAYTYLNIDAEQFSAVPTRSFHWRGLRIRVPTNYDPETRTYTGTWDGTYKIAYTNNPAWVYLDMATSERYGLGAFLDDSQINKWALYTIAQYCDGMVPDGNGGTEPRFTFNKQIMDRQEAFKLMQALAEVFRGMAYWTGSTLECFQDAPEDPGLLYSPANVVDGNFAYADTSERGLHSVFIAYWDDMSQMGKSVPEAYAPSDLIDRYGMREVELKPMGCTSQGMAARLCRWARYTEQMEGETVTFTVGSDGIVAAPGKVFKIADPNAAGERMGGRIINATLSQLVVDAPVPLAAGETFTVSVLQPDSSNHMGYVVEERTITNAASAGETILNVTPAFSAVPNVGTIWIVQSAGIEATTWRCLAVEEVAGKNQYQITGVAHNPSKFDAIELGLALDVPIVTRLTTDSLPPQSLTLLETVYTDKTVNKTSLTMSIVPSSTGKRNKFSYRVDNGWWVDLPETSEQTVTLSSIDAGLYEVSVRSCNALGVWSAAITKSVTLVGGKAGIKAISISSNSLTFKLNAAGTSSSPAAITLMASVGSLNEADIVWSVTSGTATLTGTGLSRTLALAGMTTDTVSIRAQITEGGTVYADTVTLSKVRDGAAGADGEDGDDGAAGPKYAQVALYQWATTQPGAPSGQSTFTWATAAQTSYTGGNSWQVSMPANPGTAGLKLWAATLQIAAAGADTTTTVLWSSSATISAVGSNGAGVQSVEVAAYAWAVNLASLPALTGSAAYTWSTAVLSAVPASWSATPGTSTTAGLTLFKATVRLQDATTVTSTAVNWTLASIAAVGYAGTSGSSGSSAVSAALSNESHVLPADNAGAVTSYVGSGTEIRVYEGATELAYDGAGTAAGTWTVASTVTNITRGTITDSGTYATVGVASGVASGTDTASIVYAITGKNAAGTSFFLTKTQTFTKAKQGAAGTAGASATVYWLTGGAAAIQKSAAGVYTPSTVTFSAYSATGSASPALYAGRFVIATSTDGSAYTDQYTSSANESSKSYTVPASIKTMRVRLYLAGGTTTLLDEEIVTVVTDGSTGTSGAQGASARIAYAKVSGSTIGSGTVTTAGNTSFPPDNSWGKSETWAGTVPTFSADESVMVTDGIYDPTTGNTVWGSPYLASFRAGSLSAISANLGTITAGSISINGKFAVSADGYLVAKGVQIQDESGNVILSTKTGSTASLPSSWVSASPDWLNSTAIATAAADATSKVNEAKNVRPNLLKYGSLAQGMTGWTGTSSALWAASDSPYWGRQAFTNSIASGTGALRHESVPVSEGQWLVVHGDALLFATSGTVYFDVLFLDSAGAVVSGGDGPQNQKSATFDFSSTDENRRYFAVEAQAPAGSTQAVARFVWTALVGCTALGFRLVKLESGRLPFTTYSNESGIQASRDAADAAQSTANSAVSPTNKITAANASVLIDTAAIGAALIGQLSTANLTVSTLSNVMNGSVISGERLEMALSRIDAYDSSNMLRGRFGRL